MIGSGLRVALGFAFASIVVAATLVPATAASASSTLSVTVNSIQRSTATGGLVLDIDALATAHKGIGGVCSSGSRCYLVLQGKKALTGVWDNIQNPGNMMLQPDPYLRTFSGNVEFLEITAIRVVLGGDGGEVYSSDYAVTDFSPTATADITIESIGRDSGGDFTYDVTVFGSYFKLPGETCSSTYYCTAALGVM